MRHKLFHSMKAFSDLTQNFSENMNLSGKINGKPPFLPYHLYSEITHKANQAHISSASRFKRVYSRLPALS